MTNWPPSKTGHSEKKIKPIQESYRRTANVDNLQVPKVDIQLCGSINHITRSVDMQIQQNMDTVAYC